jgi:phosphoribosylaminoimidazole-succinocarboxamide synthase
VDKLKDIALKVNEILLAYLSDKKIDLVDFKLEFGLHNGEVILGDEISPDTCRFWDRDTREKLDKDRFRRDLGSVEEAYAEVFRRLTGKSSDQM